MYKLLISAILVCKAYSYNVCVVGGSSGLGKELIYQSLSRNLTVLGLTSNTNPITLPCRRNSFEEIKSKVKFEHPDLCQESYWDDLSNLDYENVIFTTSAKPFQSDYSDRLMKKVLQDLPSSCNTISLVSAFGVGNSLKDSNAGIQIMNRWYLQDVYKAKNIQEEILNLQSPNIKKFIYRPKALSYGKTNIDSVTRKELANEILSNIYGCL